MRIRLKISDNQKLLILSLVVGLCSGAAAVVLSKSISLLQKVLLPMTTSGETSWYLLFLPAVGMLLSLLILRFVVKDDIGHGVTKVLKAVSTGESQIKPHNMWSSLLTSSLTIGFGGSVGAEAPIVYTGAAFGSNLGKWAGLSRRNITTLLGCGAAGAVAGIFKAPLAGVLFTLEILLFNISMSSMMPLLISTVSATMVSYLFLGQGTMFSCYLTPFNAINIPFYLVLGCFCGLVSLYFQNFTLKMEDALRSFNRPFFKWMLCALGLGVMLYLLPPLFGEGYGLISEFLNGEAIEYETLTPLGFLLKTPWGWPAFFLLVLLCKVISMTLTNAGGGVGGTFGPTLFVGAMAGFVVARSLNLLLSSSSLTVPEQNFVLVGMAGAMAGVMKAPMTAIFLIAEISGGYELLIPLIITSTTSYGISRISEKYSIYTKRLAQSGELLTHDSDQAVLTLMKTSDLVRDKYPRVRKSDSLGSLVDVIASSTAAVIAVVDSRDNFKGYIDVGNVRKYLFNVSEYDHLKVSDLMEDAPAIVTDDEKMESVILKFDRTQAWRLPVVSSQTGKYIGFLSRSRILTSYRELLKDFSQD